METLNLTLIENAGVNKIPEPMEMPDDVIITGQQDMYFRYGVYLCPDDIEKYYIAGYYIERSKELYFVKSDESLSENNFIGNEFRLYVSPEEIINSYNKGEIRGYPYILLIFELKKNIEKKGDLFLVQKNMFFKHSYKKDVEYSDFKEILNPEWKMPSAPKDYDIPIAFYCNNTDSIILDWSRESLGDFYSAKLRGSNWSEPIINWPFKKDFFPSKEIFRSLGFFFYEGNFTSNCSYDYDDWIDHTKSHFKKLKKELPCDVDWFEYWDKGYAPKEVVRLFLKMPIIIDEETYIGMNLKDTKLQQYGTLI